jgi:hypothetical protein
MREIQGVNGPYMCLAASKFLVLKALGMIDPDRHLRDFLRSSWAAKNAALPLANCWGWTMSRYNDDFNRTVLPAALNDGAAGVRSGTWGKVEARYVYFRNSVAHADGLLQSGVPLVVGVGIGGPGQDHHIAVVPGTDSRIWAVDPYPGSANEAVKALPTGFTFARPLVIDLALAQLHIPCGVPVFGYYRDADYESRYVFKVQ